MNFKVVNAEEGFLELLHMVKELSLYANYGKGENMGRRKVDGYLTDFSVRLDKIIEKHIGKENDGTDKSDC